MSNINNNSQLKPPDYDDFYSVNSSDNEDGISSEFVNIQLASPPLEDNPRSPTSNQQCVICYEMLSVKKKEHNIHQTNCMTTCENETTQWFSHRNCSVCHSSICFDCLSSLRTKTIGETRCPVCNEIDYGLFIEATGVQLWSKCQRASSVLIESIESPNAELMTTPPKMIDLSNDKICTLCRENKLTNSLDVICSNCGEVGWCYLCLKTRFKEIEGTCPKCGFLVSEKRFFKSVNKGLDFLNDRVAVPFLNRVKVIHDKYLLKV